MYKFSLNRHFKYQNQFGHKVILVFIISIFILVNLLGCSSIIPEINKKTTLKSENEPVEFYEVDVEITYDQLAKTPNDYIGKNVMFYGEVLQVLEEEDETYFRFAVNSNFDEVICVAYKNDIISSKILEEDHITILGLFYGLTNYESNKCGIITIPGVIAYKIE